MTELCTTHAGLDVQIKQLGQHFDVGQTRTTRAHLPTFDVQSSKNFGQLIPAKIQSIRVSCSSQAYSPVSMVSMQKVGDLSLARRASSCSVWTSVSCCLFSSSAALRACSWASKRSASATDCNRALGKRRNKERYGYISVAHPCQ